MVGSTTQLTSNHRIIRFEMAGQVGLPVFALCLFNEHCIFLDGQHRPMAISRQSFERLLAIVEQFRIFCGFKCGLTNCGEALFTTHDHYQGRPSRIPYGIGSLAKAFRFAGFEQVKAGIVKLAYVSATFDFGFPKRI